MNVLLQLANLSKSFPGVSALQDVNLMLRHGSIHALVGENGAGKSTLINILSGVLSPDSGEIRIDGRTVSFADARAARRQGIVTVHQEGDLFPDLTVAENIGLERGLPANRWGWIDWRKQHQQTQTALQTVSEDIAPSTVAATLTPAQRQMVEIAAAVSQSARVLILDEPTSSLSDAEARVLFQHLRRCRDQGTAIIYVSHRLEEIFDLASEVTVLRDGQRVWTGPISDSSPSRLIALMVGRMVGAAGQRPSREFGQVRLACRNLSASDGSFTNISLEVHAGEILGLYGLIGAGRSEWGQALFGLRRLAGGEVWIDQQPGTGHGPAVRVRQGLIYLPEDRLRQGLCRGLAVRANVVLAALRRLARWGWVWRSQEVRQTRATVDQLAVRLRSIEQAVGTLSGGNQQKVVLGRWLGCEPQVLILDEPTRGVDVGAKEEIHGLIHRLAEQGRAVVLISSDLPEVLAQSDRVGVFREGRLAATFDPRTATAEEVAAAAVPAGTRKPDAPKINSQTRGLSAVAPLLREASLLMTLLLFYGFLHGWTDRFLTVENLRELATDAALLGFCAVGAAIVIVAGGLDISLGALMALSAAVAGQLWAKEYPWPVVMTVAMLLGAGGGMLNAGLSLLGRVHPIVVTLGTLSLYRGLTLAAMSDHAGQLLGWQKGNVLVPGTTRNWLFAQVLGLPIIAWLGFALVLIVWLALTRTVFGREFYALGSNPAAAHRVGIHRARVWLRAFALQGMLAGLAGLLLLARSGNVQPTSYEDKTLEAIAAAVVGGVAITGGRGSVWGVVLGCLFLVSLAPACQFLQVPITWQQVLVGGVLVAAVVTDALWRRRSG